MSIRPRQPSSRAWTPGAPPGRARPVQPEETAAGPRVEGLEKLSDAASWTLAHLPGQAALSRLAGGTPRAPARAAAGSGPGGKAGQDARRQAVALALVGVTVVNTLAPLWGPALARQAHPASRLLDRLLESGALQEAKGLSRLDLWLAQLDGSAADLLLQADHALGQLDAALLLPVGTSREVGVVRALVDVGVDEGAAVAAARMVERAEAAATGIRALKTAIDEGKVDVAQAGHQAAALLDKTLTDPHLTLAFLAGFALVPAPVQHGAQTLVRVGKVLVDAKLRHDHAVDALKHADTGNAALDAVARLAGEAVDAVSFALLFLGPGPVLSAARGTDLLLVASEMVAAKTAVKGTLKSLESFSALPEDVAAFALGTVAAAQLRDEGEALGLEGQAVVEQATHVFEGVRAAVQERDPQRALQGLVEAWHSMTPHEQAALQGLLRRGAEKVMWSAGVSHAPSIGTHVSAAGAVL